MKRPKDAGTSPWRKRSPSSSTAASARPGIPSSAKRPSEADADGEKTGILPAFFYCFKWLARAPVRRFSFFAGDAGLNHDKKVFSHADADPHCSNKEFPARCGPAIQVRTCPKHTNFSILGIRFQRRRHSFRPPGKSVGQERTAARSFRPEIWRLSADGMKLARCARSDSHSVRALRAVKSPPCGAGLHSNGRGAAPMLSCWFSGGADSHTLQNASAHCAQTQMRRVRVKYAGAGPHPSRGFPTCPWKICVAASRLPCL